MKKTAKDLGPKDAIITVMGDCVIVRRRDGVRYHYPAQMSGASCRRVLDLLEKCRQGEWANRFYWEGGANEA